MRIATLILVCSLGGLAAKESLANDVQQTVNPSGTWRWEYDWEGQTIKDSLQLSLDDDGKLIGTFKGRNDPVEVQDAKIEGDFLWLRFPVTFDGAQVVLTFSGTIEKDDIVGEVVAEDRRGSSC